MSDFTPEFTVPSTPPPTPVPTPPPSIHLPILELPCDEDS